MTKVLQRVFEIHCKNILRMLIKIFALANLYIFGSTFEFTVIIHASAFFWVLHIIIVYVICEGAVLTVCPSV